jgi:hypothetical protein
VSDPGTPGGFEAWVREVALPYGPVAGVEVRRRDFDAVVALAGQVVVKVHGADADVDDLVTRLGLGGPAMATALEPRPRRVPDGTGYAGRLATVWPRLETLSPDSAEIPWAEAARLLAAVHTGPVPPGAARLVLGWPARVERAAERVRRGTDGGAPRVVLSAADALLAELDKHGNHGPADAPLTLVHGDWHLGQLGLGPGGWRLLDIDDLAVGDPAWDLARPAGFWAAGLLPDGDWAEFLGAYREAGGPAVPAEGDPWPRLDIPARSAVVVAAARALTRVHQDGWDDAAEALVATCLRLPRTVPGR